MDDDALIMHEIQSHFDNIAHKYDFYKAHAWYYYHHLKNIIQEHTQHPEQKRILEVGCGTGDILAYLNPKYGLGTDISHKMIDIAKKKHKQKNLKFVQDAIETSKVRAKFDIIILPDVIEHLANIKQAFHSLSRIADGNTKIIITMINPIWEPILLVGEKLGKKMPEGPHSRISFNKTRKLLTEEGLKVANRKFYMFLPVHLPVISEVINNIFYKTPLIRKLGLIEVIEVKKHA